MLYRPLSFTKNLGGLETLHRAIRAAYVKDISLDEFKRRLSLHDQGKFLIVAEFFLATRLHRNREIIAEDSLIRQTLEQRTLSLTLKRLYLFALILDMPGQRNAAKHQSPAAAQNAYVREVLYGDKGWVASRLDINRHMEPWVRRNVAMTTAFHKFCTNFHFFFDQCQFAVSSDGYLTPFYEYWGPLAIQLFFERFVLTTGAANLDDLIRVAYDREIYKLLGMPKSQFDTIIDGAALAFIEGRLDVLIATEETPEDRDRVHAGPVGRRTRQIQQLERSSKNKKDLEAWYDRVCQMCGKRLPAGHDRLVIEFAHIKPLGAPHDGPDHLSNMLSACPNHHRQLDRGALTIDSKSFEIKTPYGSSPDVLEKLKLNPSHRINKQNLEYHQTKIFRS